MNKKKKNVLLGIGVGFILFALIFSFVRDKKRKEAFESGEIRNYGVIIRHKVGGHHAPEKALIKYKVDGIIYEFWDCGNYDAYELGDSIEIVYAKNNHDIARVID